MGAAGRTRARQRRVVLAWVVITITGVIYFMGLCSLPVPYGFAVNGRQLISVEKAMLVGIVRVDEPLLGTVSFHHGDSGWFGFEKLVWWPETLFDMSERVRFFKVPLFYPFLVGLIAFCVLFMRGRVRRGGCRECGYDLQGLTVGACCPECGSSTN